MTRLKCSYCGEILTGQFHNCVGRQIAEGITKDRPFTVIENHKGTWCPYKSLFCQEGYCSECEIYQRLKQEKKK